MAFPFRTEAGEPSSLTVQATPRSLRSFFDSTPPDLLDCQFSSLLLVSRATLERNHAEISSLRTQLEEKKSELEELVAQNDGAADSKVLEVRISELAKRNDALNEANKKLQNEIKTSEARGRAKAEVEWIKSDGPRRLKELEERTQKLTVELEEGKHAVARLEIRNRTLVTELGETKPTISRHEAANSKLTTELEEAKSTASRLTRKTQSLSTELEAAKSEVSRLGERNQSLIAELEAARSAAVQRGQSVGSQGGAAGRRGNVSADTLANQEARLSTLRVENKKLLERLQASEDKQVGLEKINRELLTVVQTNENSNVLLQRKNLDLEVQCSALESENQAMHKRDATHNKLQEEKETLAKRAADLQTKIESLRADAAKNDTAYQAKLEELNFQITNSRAETDRLRLQVADNISNNRRSSDVAKTSLVDENIRLNTEYGNASRKLEEVTKLLLEQKRLVDSRDKKLEEVTNLLMEQTRLVESRDTEIKKLGEHSKLMQVDIDSRKTEKEKLRKEISILKTDNVELQRRKDKLAWELEDLDQSFRIYRQKNQNGRPERPPFGGPPEPSNRQDRRNSGAAITGAYSRSSGDSPVAATHGSKRPGDELGSANQGSRKRNRDGNGEGNSDGTRTRTQDGNVVPNGNGYGNRDGYGYRNGNGNGNGNGYGNGNGSGNRNGNGDSGNTTIRAGATTEGDQSMAAQLSPVGAARELALVRSGDRPPPPPPLPPPPPSLPSRSLFDRITNPASPHRAPNRSPDIEVETIVNSARTGRRVIIGRFRGGSPDIASLVALICGGPIEAIRMADDEDTASIYFLHPHQAESFLQYAERNLNHGQKRIGHASDPNRDVSVHFSWNERPVQPIDRELASAIVHHYRSRVFKFYCVPHDISLRQCLEKITTIVGGSSFMLKEAAILEYGREVEVEFLSVEDARDAKRRLDSHNIHQPLWDGIRFCKEECDRPVPRPSPGAPPRPERR